MGEELRLLLSTGEKTGHVLMIPCSWYSPSCRVLFLSLHDICCTINLVLSKSSQSSVADRHFHPSILPSSTPTDPSPPFFSASGMDLDLTADPSAKVSTSGPRKSRREEWKAKRGFKVRRVPETLFKGRGVKGKGGKGRSR